MARTILMVVLILISIFLTVVILFQEGKTQGLGSLGGQMNTESYWSKNKGRSREGILVKLTTAAVVLFFIISAVLNIAAI